MNLVQSSACRVPTKWVNLVKFESRSCAENRRGVNDDSSCIHSYVAGELHMHCFLQLMQSFPENEELIRILTMFLVVSNSQCGQN